MDGLVSLVYMHFSTNGRAAAWRIFDNQTVDNVAHYTKKKKTINETIHAKFVSKVVLKELVHISVVETSLTTIKTSCCHRQQEKIKYFK